MLLAHHMDNTDKAAYWEQMREAMDTDGDGKISRQEYIDFNKNNSNWKLNLSYKLSYTNKEKTLGLRQKVT